MISRSNTACMLNRSLIRMSQGPTSLAIARPFTNHSTGCITSPARRRKGLVPLHTAFRCSGMQFIHPQIADFMSTLSIPVGRYTNTSFEFATGKLENTLFLFFLQFVPQKSCSLGYCRSHIRCLRLRLSTATF